MRLILEKFTRFDPDSFSLILRLENTLASRAKLAADIQVFIRLPAWHGLGAAQLFQLFIDLLSGTTLKASPFSKLEIFAPQSSNALRRSVM